MMQMRVSLLVVVVSVAVGAGCPPSNGSGGEGEGEGEGEGDATPDDLVAAYTDFLDRCLPSAIDPFSQESEPIFFTEVLRQAQESFGAAVDATVNSPNVTFHSDSAAECIAALNDINCDGVFDDAQPTGCDDVLEGNLSDGDDCAFNDECGDGSSCFQTSDTECGTCTPRVGDGGDCTAADCAEGFDCVVDTCETTTAPPPPPGLGDACTQAPDNCDAGLRCQDGANVCATVAVVGVGQECDELHYCVNTITRNVCLPGNPGNPTCTERPGDGDGCLAGTLCQADTTVCGDDVVCHTGGDVGDACVGDEDCRVFNECTVTTCTEAFATEPLTCPN